MAEQSLIERAAEDEIEKGETNEKYNFKDLVYKVQFSESHIKYQNVNDEWKELCSISNLIKNSVGDLLEDEDIFVSDSVKRDLQEFRAVVNACWNEKHNMFKVDYNTDEDGDLKSLVVPLNSPLSDDVVIHKIHNCKGEFVAKDIENSIDQNMYELWNMDMYTESLEENSPIYTITEDTRSRREIFGDSLESQSRGFESGSFLDQDGYIEWIFKTTVSTSACLLYGFMISFAFTNFNLFGVTVLLLGSMFGMIPLMIILTTVLQYMMGITSAKKAILQYKKEDTELFFRV